MILKVKNIIGVLVFLFIVYLKLEAQIVKFNDEAEKYFLEAIEKYDNKDYDSAVQLFQKLSQMPLNHRSTASWIMLAKSYYKLGKFQESIEISNKLISLFPNSIYIDDAYYTLGSSQYEFGDYINSFHSLLNAMILTNDKKLHQNTLNFLEMVSQKKLSEGDISQIIKKNENKEIYDLIVALYSNKLFEAGNVKPARNLLRKVVENPTSNKFRDYVEKVWLKIHRKYQLRIGVLVPLMASYADSRFAEVGRDILNGIQIAVDEYNLLENSDYEVILEIRDTERMPSKAFTELKNMVEEDKLLCVVGPIFSNEAVVCAEYSQKNKILMITPTATANGIGSIGEYVFQINPDYRSRGLALARVAVEHLGLVNLAVVSPNDASSRSVVESFIKEANRLGAEIVSVVYYEKDNKDLSEQFKSLRKLAVNLEPKVSFSNKINVLAKMKILNQGVNSKLLDSLIESGASIGVNRLFGKRGTYIADSLGLVYSFPINYPDSSYSEVSSLHGIIFPISSPEEISTIATQLNYFNIRTQILGTSDWYDEAELMNNKNYLEDLVFISEFFVNNEMIDVQNFISKYRKKFGYIPTKNSYYGYDIMSLIISLVKQGNVNTELLKKALINLKDFPTLHTKVTVDKDGINTQFNVLKFSKGRIYKIGDVK